MSDANVSLCLSERAKVELRCLGRAVIPMPEDNGRKVAKAVGLILVAAWAIITVSLTFEDVATATPPHYGFFTAIVFLLVGKLWDLEVQAYLPGGGN